MTESKQEKGTPIDTKYRIPVYVTVVPRDQADSHPCHFFFPEDWAIAQSRFGLRGFFEPDEKGEYLVQWTYADEVTDDWDNEEVRELFSPAQWW